MYVVVEDFICTLVIVNSYKFMSYLDLYLVIRLFL